MSNVAQTIDTTLLDPATIAVNMPAYEAAYDALHENILMIQAQLTNKKVVLNDELVPFAEYHQWRRRAVYALQRKIIERRALKTAIHQARMLLDRKNVLGVEDAGLPMFLLVSVRAIDGMLERLPKLKASLPPDEDLDDLTGCLVENLAELRGMLAQYVSSDQAAS